MTSLEDIEVVYFRNTAHSFVKAYLLKLLTGASMLPESQMELSHMPYLSHTLTHRFSLDELMEALGEQGKLGIADSNQLSFQLIMKKLNWMMNHASAHKFFLGRKVLDKIFLAKNEISQRIQMKSILGQTCLEGVQLNRYVNDVYQEYQNTLQSQPVFQSENAQLVFELFLHHPIQDFLIPKLIENFGAEQLILRFPNHMVLMDGQQKKVLQFSLPVRDGSSFNRLWGNHMKKQSLLPVNQKLELKAQVA